MEKNDDKILDLTKKDNEKAGMKNNRIKKKIIIGVVAGVVLILAVILILIGGTSKKVSIEKAAKDAWYIPSYVNEKKSQLFQIYYTDTSEIPIEIDEYAKDHYQYYENYNYDDLEKVDYIYYVNYSVEESNRINMVTLYYINGKLAASYTNRHGVNPKSPFVVDTPSEIDNDYAYDWKLCDTDALVNLNRKLGNSK